VIPFAESSRDGERRILQDGASQSSVLDFVQGHGMARLARAEQHVEAFVAPATYQELVLAASRNAGALSERGSVGLEEPSVGAGGIVEPALWRFSNHVVHPDDLSGPHTISSSSAEPLTEDSFQDFFDSAAFPFDACVNPDDADITMLNMVDDLYENPEGENPLAMRPHDQHQIEENHLVLDSASPSAQMFDDRNLSDIALVAASSLTWGFESSEGAPVVHEGASLPMHSQAFVAPTILDVSAASQDTCAFPGQENVLVNEGFSVGGGSVWSVGSAAVLWSSSDHVTEASSRLEEKIETCLPAPFPHHDDDADISLYLDDLHDISESRTIE
jgi:hypothetical protein